MIVFVNLLSATMNNYTIKLHLDLQIYQPSGYALVYRARPSSLCTRRERGSSKGHVWNAINFECCQYGARYFINIPRMDTTGKTTAT